MLEGRIYGKAPSIDLEEEKTRQEQLLKAIRTGIVQSAHDISEGGLAVALAECMMEGEVGAKVQITGDAVTALFAESQSRFIVTVKKEHEAEFAQMVNATKIGEVTSDKKLVITNESGDVVLEATQLEMADAWKGAIPCLLKSKA